MRNVFKKMEYRNKSFWLEGGEYTENPPLADDTECDLAIIGGGFTGLSGTYHIKKHDPSMNVVLLEAQVIGFGASGRNGGFSMPLLGWDLTYLLWYMGVERGKMAHDYANDCVKRTKKLVEEEGIDCDFEYTGLMEVARTPFQLKRLEKEVEHYHRIGYPEVEFLDKQELKNHLNSAVHMGGRRDPDTAIIDPAKMARGLKNAVQKLGVSVYERTPVTEYTPGDTVELVTPRARVRAKNVIVATNAFSMYLKVKHRYFVPMFTYIILTEPLGDKQYDELGWVGREGIEDERIFVHYLRLTADNRLLFGGRDAPYYFGNSVVGHESHGRIFQNLERDMKEMFPVLEDVGISHKWGGPVAVTLDFVPTFGRLKEHGNVLFAIGYCGHGVSLSLNAGRILRDLLFERDTDLVRLPLVNNKLIPLPPEPFRYVFANGVRGLLRAFDAVTELRH